MTQAPVSLDEVRAHLNFTEDDGHDFDDELWSTTLSATAIVEADVGAIRPTTRSDRVRASGYCFMRLPGFPVLSVDTMADQNGNAVDVSTLVVRPSGLVERTVGGFGSTLYTVGYTVGQDPIDPDLVHAVLLKAGLLWSTQRGPVQSSRFTAMGGVTSPGGIDNKQLEKILRDHKPVLVG